MRAIRSFIIACLLSLLVVFPGAAQASIVFDTMEIEIWPEYDRAEVLVIYRITLASDVALPTQVSLKIPRAAGAPYSLAWQDVDGSLYNLSYTTQVQGDWLVVTFTPQAEAFQLEYYDPSIKVDQTVRSFSYQWSGDYQVNTLNVSIQQPRTADPMTITPSFGAGSLESDGLIYYNKQVGSVDAGVPFKISFTYVKNDDELSVGMQPVESADPAQPSGVDLEGVLPWIIVAVLAIMIISAVMWYLLTRQRPLEKVQHRRRRSSAQKKEIASSATDEESIHCHRCGKKAASGDVFCRSCGTKLRRD
jgi:hypothetical protein